MDEKRFEIIVPASAMACLLDDPLVASYMIANTEAPRKHALRLGISEVASVVTIVVGAAKLVEFCRDLVASLRKKAAAKQEEMQITVRTGSDDVMIRITLGGNDAALAETITKILLRD